ncbi:hypothetical protein BHE74_00025422 [Ensete ventricosum]|nr:hypothetical protein BHE74_00025422 [Ensete ventricosum]
MRQQGWQGWLGNAERASTAALDLQAGRVSKAKGAMKTAAGRGGRKRAAIVRRGLRQREKRRQQPMVGSGDRRRRMTASTMGTGGRRQQLTVKDGRGGWLLRQGRQWHGWAAESDEGCGRLAVEVAVACMGKMGKTTSTREEKEAGVNDGWQR